MWVLFLCFLRVWCCFLMLVCTLECFFFFFFLFFHELDVVFTCFFFFQTFFLFYLLPVFSHSVFRVFTVTSVFLPFLSRGFISFLDFDCWFFFSFFLSFPKCLPKALHVFSTVFGCCWVFSTCNFFFVLGFVSVCVFVFFACLLVVFW